MREHADRSGGWFGALAPWQRAHEDQGRVGGLLAELGPEGFRSLHRVDSSFGDIDHVVVGPTGVFSILTTHWTAPVHRKGDRLVCGARDEDKTRRRAEWSATCVEQWLDDDDVFRSRHYWCRSTAGSRTTGSSSPTSPSSPWRR